MHTILAALLSSSLVLASCASGEASTSASTADPTNGASPTAATAADLTICVQETNRYRASIGLNALSQSAALESYAATGARVDGSAHAGHSHFNSDSGGGIAMEIGRAHV